LKYRKKSQIKNTDIVLNFKFDNRSIHSNNSTIYYLYNIFFSFCALNCHNFEVPNVIKFRSCIKQSLHFWYAKKVIHFIWSGGIFMDISNFVFIHNPPPHLWLSSFGIFAAVVEAVYKSKIVQADLNQNVLEVFCGPSFFDLRKAHRWYAKHIISPYKKKKKNIT